MKEPEEKRRPLLADRFLHRKWGPHDQILHPKALEQVQRGVRNARKFVLDEQAAERLADVIMDVPQLLVREHDFARTPFDLTWIEFPSYAYWNRLRARNPEAYDEHNIWYDPDTADYEVGFLIDHYRVNTISGGTVSKPDEMPRVSLLQYQLHTEWLLEDQIAFAQAAGTSRLNVMAFMWGSTFGDLDHDQRRVLRNNNVVELVPANPRHPKASWLHEPAQIQRSIRGSTGDPRTVIALLLMLNRPSITRYRNVPQSRGWLRSKPIPYLSHSVVNINLDATRTLQLVGTPAGDSVPRRAHEVRAHYCHDKTARDYMRIAGCIHEWVRTDDEWTPLKEQTGPDLDVRHWRCSVCEGKRWRRDEHTRGDASRGFVVHDGYDVTDR